MHCFEDYKNPRRLVGFLLGSAGLSILFIFLGAGKNETIGEWIVSFLWGFSIAVTQWFGLSCINKYLNSRFSWMETPVKILAIEIVAFLAYSSGAFILVQLFNFYVWTQTAPSESIGWILRSMPYTLVASLGCRPLVLAVTKLRHS